ncbi:MAG TPA: DinB family protein [Gemmatimonadaceae bacterium]|nr:DinB family protein [Gemmatimonadaceae bacterium]
MDVVEAFRRMWDHAAWSDELLLSELEAMQPPPAVAWREYAHVLGAESVWLDRLLQRPQRYAVWPELSAVAARSLAASLRAEYAAYVAGLSADALDSRVAYVNSAGQSFETPVSDILLQVALHGQYHRGKINLLLRQAHLPPTPTDYIAFARGVPAAVTRVSGR